MALGNMLQVPKADIESVIESVIEDAKADDGAKIAKGFVVAQRRDGMYGWYPVSNPTGVTELDIVGEVADVGSDDIMIVGRYEYANDEWKEILLELAAGGSG